MVSVSFLYMGKNLILSSNRAMLSFSEAMMKEAYAAISENRPPVGPPFGEGGLIQATSGLFKPGKWRAVGIGSAMSDADYDVERGRYEALFDELAWRGYTPNHFPSARPDSKGRLHIDYTRDTEHYSFAQRFMHFNTKHMASFYENASNEGIWFAMHLAETFLPDVSKTYPMPHFDYYDNVQYRSANVTFSNSNFEEILNSQEILPPSGQEELFVWLHDYHLMETSLMLRSELCRAMRDEDLTKEQMQNIYLGQFIHIPCMSVENFDEFIGRAGGDSCAMGWFDPSRKGPKEILEGHIGGLLGNHFIGFHTKRFVDNFVGLAEHLFDLDARPVDAGDTHVYELSHGGNPLTWVGASPIGVDVDRILGQIGYDKPIEHTFEQKGEQVDLESLMQQYKHDKKLRVLSLGRRDPTKNQDGEVYTFKGLTERIRANDIGYSDARMIQVTQKSRENIKAYRDYSDAVMENTHSVNEALGEDTIVQLTQGIRPPQNFRLMSEADVMFTVPHEDGFNLTTNEYILSQSFKPYEERGLLVVGNCGAADYFDEHGFGMEDGVVRIDPHDHEGGAERIMEALTKGYRLTDRLVNHIKTKARVEDWAEHNTDLMREAGHSMNARSSYFLDS